MTVVFTHGGTWRGDGWSFEKKQKANICLGELNFFYVVLGYFFYGVSPGVERVGAGVGAGVTVWIKNILRMRCRCCCTGGGHNEF